MVLRRVLCCRGKGAKEGEVAKETETEVIEDDPTSTNKAVTGDEVDQSEQALEAGLAKESNLSAVETGEVIEVDEDDEEEVTPVDDTEKMGDVTEETEGGEQQGEPNKTVLEEKQVNAKVNNKTDADSVDPPPYNEVVTVDDTIADNVKQETNDNLNDGNETNVEVKSKKVKPTPSAPPLSYSLQDKLRAELSNENTVSDQLVYPKNLNEQTLNENLIKELDNVF